MKTIKITLGLLLACSLVFTSCKKESEATAVTPTTTSTKALAKAETTTFKIEGMTCAMGCAKTIETKVASLEGIQKATVDFDKKTATIEYDAAIQTPEKIVETVEAVADGKTYKVSDVKSSADKAMLYQEKQDQEKKKKKSKKATDEASASSATPSNTPAKSCDPKEEKKGGCCASKKSCEKPTTM